VHYIRTGSVEKACWGFCKVILTFHHRTSAFRRISFSQFAWWLLKDCEACSFLHKHWFRFWVFIILIFIASVGNSVLTFWFHTFSLLVKLHSLFSSAVCCWFSASANNVDYKEEQNCYNNHNADIHQSCVSSNWWLCLSLTNWSGKNSGSKTSANLESKTNSWSVFSIKRCVEIVIKNVSENPVVDLCKVLSNDSKVTIIDLLLCVYFREQIVLCQ